ncbi:MAG TPA: type IX secretion system protein PorQ [Candidatus Kapabacteria bacterium]|nr:type IX secretion system protein PorQ [Candidatus Kapabacteria bacterium]HOV92653.1 type IX secretion system protein PorQ [Candidatus Kapabacteria bacterium]
MQKKFIIIIILLTALSTTIAKSENTFNFLRLAGNARSSALAGSFICIENDINAIYFNPATLWTVEDRDFSVTFLKHTLDINSGNASYKLPVEWMEGKFAAAATFTNYGSFDYADKEGIKGGTFSASDLDLAFYYSNKIDTNFFYGAGIKFIYSGIEKYSSTALALDLGILYKLKDGRTNIGVSLLHTGFQLSSYSGESENLPIDLRIGFNHHLIGLPLLFNFNFHHLADNTNKFGDRFKNFSVGGEFYIGENVDLRIGYDNQVRNVLTNNVSKGLSGFNAGVGIKTKYLDFDYGFSQYSSAVNLHRFSISLNL